MSTRHIYSIPILALALAGVLALPSSAEAQRRGPRGRAHATVFISGGYGYPGLWFYDPFFYDPWYQYGPGPWGPYGPYRPYGRYGIDDFSAQLKFSVKPKDSEVYVDGALAGEIDDFDGIFQSLRLRPGNHEIVVFHDGFRSYRENVYLEPYHSKKLEFTMEPLAAGDRQELRPQPPAPGPDPRVNADPRSRGREVPRQVPPPRQGPPPPPRQPERTAPPEQRRAEPDRFGTLSIRVVPSDADVFVDGERWAGPADAQRLSIQLAPGRHKVEVRKQGLTTYTEEVLIRQGSTLTLNVSLK